MSSIGGEFRPESTSLRKRGKLSTKQQQTGFLHLTIKSEATLHLHGTGTITGFLHGLIRSPKLVKSRTKDVESVQKCFDTMETRTAASYESPGGDEWRKLDLFSFLKINCGHNL